VKQYQKLPLFLSILLVVAIIATAIPKQASAFAFGGRIISSRATICRVGIGPYALPVPLQIIRVQRTGIVRTLVYTYYQPFLALFGLNTGLYNYYQYFRAGPSALGTYIPLPIPWASPGDCADLKITNIILKIGTSF